jgi:C4-dicarboxylate transporter DctM subunit
LKWSDFLRIAGEAGITSSVIMSIVITASLFVWILNTQGLVAQGASLLISIDSNHWILLLLINGILLIAGLFLDAISIFYIFLPILLPAVKSLGINPVHFGIIMTVNLAIGQVIPPVGINLVAASGVSGISIKRISRSVIPFIARECIALILITYISELSLFLLKLL